MRLFRHYLSSVAAILGFTCCYMGPAEAQNVSFECEHQSGAFIGQIWPVVIDVGAQTVWYLNWPPVPAQIGERYIVFRNYNGGASNGGLVRIDRGTGQMMFQYPNQGNWDTTFGSPGVICQRVVPLRPDERDLLRD